MSSPFPSFVDDFLRRKKLPTDNCDEDKAFHGRLRKQIEVFEQDIITLIPIFEKIFSRLVKLQYQKYSGVAWDSHWKEVSRQGFDWLHGREVDYGNVEYNMLLGCICHSSQYCNECMCWLGLHYFPTLRPDSPWTNHSVEMHGDVFEICMAALRGHIEFANDLPAVGLPELFAKLCLLCRTVQMLDAVFRTGHLKWCNDRVTRLPRLRPDLVDHPFVQGWLTDPRNAIGDLEVCSSIAPPLR